MSLRNRLFRRQIVRNPIHIRKYGRSEQLNDGPSKIDDHPTIMALQFTRYAFGTALELFRSDPLEVIKL